MGLGQREHDWPLHSQPLSFSFNLNYSQDNYMLTERHGQGERRTPTFADTLTFTILLTLLKLKISC